MPGTRQSNPRTRGAAIVALAATIAVLGILVWAVTKEFGAVFFALLFLFLLSFCAWFVLTRRGVRRVLGLVGVVVALLGLIGFADTHGLLLAMLVGAVAVFGATARYSVRHDERPVAAHDPAGTPHSARRGVLVINPKSGGGKAARYQLADEARKRGIEPVVLRPGDDLGTLAEQAVDGGADVLGMAGGDGSQALVAGIAMRHDVAHVCVPAGTRNHFALELGLDRDDVVGALDAFADGIERRIDLARVNEHVFVNNASLGLYAHVVQSDAYRDAKLGTWNRLLPELLGPEAEPIDLRFEGPDGREWTDATLVLVSNNPYQLKRLGGVGTRRRLDSGRLGIVATRVKRAQDLSRLVTLGSVGLSRRFGGVLEWSSTEFEIRSQTPIAVGLDGEALVLAPPLRFVSLPGALRVRVPRHARGVSPAGAAVSLSRRDVRRLLRIAAR